MKPSTAVDTKRPRQKTVDVNADSLLKEARSNVEIDEDKEIGWLEYQLGLSGKKKGKSWTKMLQEDGIDGK